LINIYTNPPTPEEFCAHATEDSEKVSLAPVYDLPSDWLGVLGFVDVYFFYTFLG